MRYFLFAFTLLLGCAQAGESQAASATARGFDEQWHFNPSSKITVYRDQWVQRNPPEVHVRPAENGSAAPKVLFVPFRVTQPIENPGIIGYSTARTLWQTWLTMQLFPAMEFSGDDTPYRRDRAVALGRARGVDMVVGGFVTYILAGGSVGTSQMAIQVEAHDTHSGQLIWSMAQAGMIPAERTTDYFLFTTKTRTPSDPLHAIVQAMAADMGLEMQTWTSGPRELDEDEKKDRERHQYLFGPRDPVPAPRHGASEQGEPRAFR
ncbi:hypothetical protein LJC59_05305 [Desulfovibrio sp. OttesenSCG-928-A18]|nr:hypothetical protein [Desulfovibrio sp. OttesenSCG-928-A18]